MKTNEKFVPAAAVVVAIFCLVACSGSWTSQEREIIAGPDVMRVLTIDNQEDSLVLRSISANLTKRMIRSGEYGQLAAMMLATVTDPSQDGVGIAGPQVGILRRIVAVQRFDKPSEPFEVYPNIRITAMRGELLPGPEGCLSVPEVASATETAGSSGECGATETAGSSGECGAIETAGSSGECGLTERRRGNVLRSRDIDIAYTSPLTLRDTVETITGFTAVIFQHECDHLDGVIFTDRLQ